VAINGMMSYGRGRQECPHINGEQIPATKSSHEQTRESTGSRAGRGVRDRVIWPIIEAAFTGSGGAQDRIDENFAQVLDTEVCVLYLLMAELHSTSAWPAISNRRSPIYLVRDHSTDEAAMNHAYRG